MLNLRVRPWDLLVACGAILSAATLAGFLGTLWWFLDLFSHFRVQYFLGLSAIALVLVFRRRYREPAVFLAFALLNLSVILPLYFGKEPLHGVGSRPYHALLINVNTAAGKPDRVAALIRQSGPELVVLEEVNEQWVSELRGCLRDYPHVLSMPRDDNFGIALYSKQPFARSEICQVGEADVPSAIAELEFPEGLLTVIGTHPLPPGGQEGSRLRNEQLRRLAETIRKAKSPVLLLGDLNVTPWSPHFRRLLRDSGLRDSAQGRGVLGTWPTFLPPLLIPIDHCLYTRGVHITKTAAGPNVGSDHFPLQVEFALTQRLENPRNVNEKRSR